MAKPRLFCWWLPLLVFSALGGVSHSQCLCYQITELYQQACSSTAPRCESSYPVEFCDTGGFYGICGLTGFGTCCGKTWRTHSIQRPPECIHSEDPCIGAAPRSKQRPMPVAASRLQPWRNAAPGEVDWKDNYLIYESALLIPDRCQHTYGILYFHSLGRSNNSSASSRGASVPSGGGL